MEGNIEVLDVTRIVMCNSRINHRLKNMVLYDLSWIYFLLEKEFCSLSWKDFILEFFWEKLLEFIWEKLLEFCFIGFIQDFLLWNLF